MNEERLDVSAEEDDPYLRYLCGAFHFDFRVVKTCIAMLDAIKKIQAGDSEVDGWSGDAFCTEIFADRVEIQQPAFIAYGWKIWVCDPEVFELALRVWKKFLELPDDEENEVIVELPDCPFYYKDS